ANCMAGGCDGFGHCKPAPAGTACSGYTCTNGAGATQPPGQMIPPVRNQPACDGVNASAAGCAGGTNLGCPGRLACAGTVQCQTSCTLDVDCVSGTFCNGGLCTPWRANGATCTAHRQCSSHLCLSGSCVQCAGFGDCPPNAPVCNASHV